MSETRVMQNKEKMLPIFYKKKVLPLEKTKELQEMMEELMQENEQLIANEKLMLDKIRIKDNKFVSRLEDHLEDFKKSRKENIILGPDMLPQWLQENESSKIVDEDVERLIEWHNTVSTYVSLQRDAVNQIISDWFSQLDKIANEGETDPQGAEDSDFTSASAIDYANFWENVFWYFVLIVFSVVNVFIFYEPEAFDELAHGGFCKGFLQIMLKISTFLYLHYLRFHNITLDYPPVASVNNSAYYAVLCSEETHL